MGGVKRIVALFVHRFLKKFAWLVTSIEPIYNAKYIVTILDFMSVKSWFQNIDFMNTRINYLYSTYNT